jgi:hypothetical protein
LDVFLRDRQLGLTECISVDSSGMPANATSELPSISADGRYVAFRSDATNLVVGDANGHSDIFIRDRLTATTELVSVGASGVQANADCWTPSMSADARYVAFESYATNLVGGGTSGAHHIFLRDRQLGLTECVSVDSSGVQGNDDSFWPSISSDGRYVAFYSYATNLVPGDTNGYLDVFVRDRQLGITERISVDTVGVQGNSVSQYPSISADGRYVVFYSAATTLVPGDGNNHIDEFVRDRFGASFTSVCDPGVGLVMACPCTNPPGGAGRGCDNSSSTGGAILSVSGASHIGSDSVVFTTSGEKPTATSVLLQGDSFIAAGAGFGQGVRCAGGVLLRLYTKIASAGSIAAPDLGAGDPTVSARSAALGDVIQPGQSRWYMVYYRDPIVLGGCAASSTFNATQTGRIDWSP